MLSRLLDSLSVKIIGTTVRFIALPAASLSASTLILPLALSSLLTRSSGGRSHDYNPWKFEMCPLFFKIMRQIVQLCFVIKCWFFIKQFGLFLIIC